MLLILGTALFPLGLMAILASLDAARDGRIERRALARGVAVQSATALDSLVARNLLALRMAATGRAKTGGEPARCALLAKAASHDRAVASSRLSLFGRDGRPLCGEPKPLLHTPPREAGAAEVRLEGGEGELRMAAFGETAFATAAITLPYLRSATSGSGRDVDLRLEQGGERVELADGYHPEGFQRATVSRARLAGSGVFAVASVGAIPISAAEIFPILLPLVMWLAAALLGWLVVDRLLLRPIVQMQKAVLSYQPGGPPIAVPATLTPATEIRDLGHAFVRVTETISRHESELESAVARQARLVREVHHRVKNNLQVVASLLNLHARGAKTADAAGAYATIQRRVDALAVVHRNHFAELEDDRGVALRPLLSELTGNLRATAPDGAVGTPIVLDLDAAYVNQDVAVSVAFFVTEVVEHAMLCTPSEPVTITLRRDPAASTARLSLQSASLRAGADCAMVDVRQFERITTGLSRQLRAVLERDGDAGRFGIDIQVQPTQSLS